MKCRPLIAAEVIVLILNMIPTTAAVVENLAVVPLPAAMEHVFLSTRATAVFAAAFALKIIRLAIFRGPAALMETVAPPARLFAQAHVLKSTTIEEIAEHVVQHVLPARRASAAYVGTALKALHTATAFAPLFHLINPTAEPAVSDAQKARRVSMVYAKYQISIQKKTAKHAHEKIVVL